MSEPFIQVCSALDDQIIDIRRHLHQNPELSFEEFETSAYIQCVLEKWGIPYETIGETGVYVDIVGAEEGPSLALRADIDALPILEEADVPYKSKNAHVMHACGHDGHTSHLTRCSLPITST